MNQQQSNKKQIQIKASDEDMKGKYANMMQILHTKEEFVLDYMNIFPPSGSLNSRVIVSPAHFKRMAKAMQENLKKYEDKFGKIEAGKDKKENRTIGFA